MNSSSFDLFVEQRKCSLIDGLCNDDGDCLQSCPFGEIPTTRMACIGSRDERARGAGKCGAVWAEVGDPCVVGAPGACVSRSDVNSAGLYCQQAQLTNPNLSPGFNQNNRGAGYCMRF